MAETGTTVEAGTGQALTPGQGTAGIPSQVPGHPTTVSGVAQATGGVGAGNLIEVDIDEQLFAIQSEDTALMSLMLKSRKVKVASPEVDHYMIDEQRSSVTVTDDVAGTQQMQTVLPLSSEDQSIPRPYTTLLVKGVDGYDADGRNNTPGKDLMLFVVGYDTTTNNPIVRAVNGPKQNTTDAFCGVPSIPKGTKVSILANALYETQKEVDPDLIVPQPTRVYLQKRGMNQVVSDYFDAQRKRIPFSQSLIAEQAILNFKRAGNRTLWSGRRGKFTVRVPKLGEQTIYCTEGVRWQFKREFQMGGKWTIEKLIALAKLFYTGEDVPKSAILLAGKNLLESIQCIDYSKHPEIQIVQATNSIGWSVTRVHTVFGDIDIKREPTLDVLGWSNSGALIGENRLVHYTYSTQHEFSDRVDGEEATRKGVVVWDGLALKGACHIWIDGEGGVRASDDTLQIKTWESEEAPVNPQDGSVYYLTCDCPGISPMARLGQLWKVRVTTGADLKSVFVWSEYTTGVNLSL